MARYVTQSTQPRLPGYTQTPGIFGSGNYLIYTSSGTFVPPPGTTKVRATVLGAGGGGGGNWAVACCAGDYLCPVQGLYTYAGMNSFGGGGGGGGFAVGTADVVPGCSYCIVVGAGGASSSVHYYAYANLVCTSYGAATGCIACCGGDGAAGGCSCAFGIIAYGGGGGSGARCGFCSTTNLAWLPNCQTLQPGTNNCVVWANLCTVLLSNTRPGGAGGNTSGGYFSACGAAGSNTVYSLLNFPVCSTGAPSYQSAFGCSYGCGWTIAGGSYGGASGSIFGNGVNDSICDPYGGKAFDGSSCNEEYLVNKYDLDFPKFPGKTVFSTGPGSVAATGLNATSTCCCYGSSPGYSISTAVSCKCLWSSNKSCVYFYCYTSGPSNQTTSACAAINGCGSGALPYIKSGTALNCIYCACLKDCASCGSTAGGNGLVVVEW